MSGTILQFTLREWRVVLSRPRLLGTFAIVVALFALTGPFGTIDEMGLALRLLYWFLLQGLAWSTALFCSLYAANLLRERLPPLIPRLLIGSVAASFPIALESMVLDRLLGGRALTAEAFAENIAIALPLCILFSLLTALTLGGREQAAEKVPTEAPDRKGAGPVALLRRLRPENRGLIIRLSAEDHYTEIVTLAGRELILVRFADALTELGETEGMQVHRSHWVARNAVTALRREGGRMLIESVDGTLVPVSRNKARAVRLWLGE